MNLTAENRANLEKLATYLEALPADYSHFDMYLWVSGASNEAEVRYARHNGGVASCGTAACAAGHGPAAGILVPDDLIEDWGDKEFSVDWESYCALFTGPDRADVHWCFGGTWTRHDNSHYGAAARIRYMLDKGRPPADFEYGAAEFVPLYAPYRVDAKAALSPTPQPSEEERR